MPIEGSMEALIKDEFADVPEEFRDQIPALKEIYRIKPTLEYPTGTKGRIAVSEAFEMVPELERAILARKSEEEMFSIVRKDGMLTMKEDAIIKAVKGVIPFEEVNSLGGQFELSDIGADIPPSVPKELTEEEETKSEEPQTEIQL